MPDRSVGRAVGQAEEKHYRRCPKHGFYRAGDVLFSVKYMWKDEFQKADVLHYQQVANGKQSGTLIFGLLMPTGAKKITEAEWAAAVGEAALNEQT